MSHFTELLDALTIANQATLKVALTEDNVTLSEIQVISNNVPVVNTRGTLTGVTSQGLTGSTAIAWGRIELGTLLKNIPISIVDASAKTTRDLVPWLNALYGINLDANDIVERNLPAAPTVASVSLFATDASVYWCGSVIVKFARA